MRGEDISPEEWIDRFREENEISDFKGFFRKWLGLRTVRLWLSSLASMFLLYFAVDLPWGLPPSFQTHYVPEALFFFISGYGIKSTRSYGLLAAFLAGLLLITTCLAWINRDLTVWGVATVFAASTLIGFKIRE